MRANLKSWDVKQVLGIDFGFLQCVDLLDWPSGRVSSRISRLDSIELIVSDRVFEFEFESSSIFRFKLVCIT